MELKGALYHSLLSSAVAGAQHGLFGCPGEQLEPLALCCWQESVESLRGVKEMSSLYESCHLGLLMEQVENNDFAEELVQVLGCG